MKPGMGLPSMFSSVVSARLRTRMDRDALGAETLDVQRGADHVGQIAAPRIAHHGDLIDVNA